jgi:hypothetical protein
MAPPERTISSTRLPAVPDPNAPADPFGRPITDPGAPTAPAAGYTVVVQQPAPAPAPAQTPAANSTPPQGGSGVTIPLWLIQLVPLLLLIGSAVAVFTTQRADVDQLKQSVADVKIAQERDHQLYVTKQVFDLRFTEQERAQSQLNARLDRIESLISGIYERLPAKSK